MIIENLKPFVGQHCETTATGTLLSQLDLELSEAMIFGLGEGLSYGFFNFRMMAYPFLGGRPKPFQITETLCKNLGLKLAVRETSSTKAAWANVASELGKGTAVGLQLDCYDLEYFPSKIHFAGHFATIYGYDESFAYLVDTAPAGTRSKTSLKSLAQARSQKGPMAARNRSYTIGKTRTTIDFKSAIAEAIKRNATTFLNPPINNLGYKGIAKTAAELPKWATKCSRWHDQIQTTAMIMERAGSGGSLFRNLYRDFVSESAELLGDRKLKAVHPRYVDIAVKWKEVSDLFAMAGQNRDPELLNEACKLLLTLHDLEERASACLLDI